MIKDWVNFLPSEIDRFIISPQDLVQSFQTEEELTWFGLSDKWAVKEEFKDRFPPKSHLQITPDERKVALCAPTQPIFIDANGLSSKLVIPEVHRLSPKTHRWTLLYHQRRI